MDWGPDRRRSGPQSTSKSINGIKGLSRSQLGSRFGAYSQLKVKYSDFQQITRSKTVPAPLTSIFELEEIVGFLLQPIFPARRGIRLLGVTLSSLERITDTVASQLALPLA
ncbi:hypothetical protein KXS03_29405 [Neorhizobium petrolearium]